MSGSESNSLPSTPSSGYDSPLPLPSVANAALPVPGQNARSGRPLKKSHARKQPPGHVPRPCNAFILFRCDFVRQKKIPASVERDHRNISRIAGKVWREMSETEKAPWTSMAEKEREKHSQAHPGYRYAPVGPSASSHSKRKKGKDTVEGRQRPYTPDTVTTPYRRSSSCPPPGAVPVPPNMETLTPNMMYIPRIRDDLARRPSRTIMYQIAKEDAASMSPPIDSQSYNKLSYLDDVTYPANMVYEPTYVFGRIEPPKGHPGWDASPPKPYLWTGPLQGYRGTEQHQHYYASGNFNNFNTSSPQTYFAPLSPPIFTDPFATSQSTAPSKMGSALDSLDNPRCLPAYSTMPPLADDALGFLLANPDRYPPSPYHSAQLGAAANYDPRCDIGLLLPRLLFLLLPRLVHDSFIPSGKFVHYQPRSSYASYQLSKSLYVNFEPNFAAAVFALVTLISPENCMSLSRSCRSLLNLHHRSNLVCFARNHSKTHTTRSMAKKKAPIPESHLILPTHSTSEAAAIVDTHTHIASTFEAYRHKYKEGKYETVFDFIKGVTANRNVDAVVDVWCEAPIRKLWKEFADSAVTEEDRIKNWGGLEYWFVMGVHPHEAKHYTDEVEEELLQAMAHPRCVGWGEMGLDYHYDLSPRDVQQAVFTRQLKHAVRLGKPLTIHTREANEDTERILKEEVPKDHKIHIHCFTDEPAFALRLLEHFSNLYIGVTGVITYTSNDNTSGAIYQMSQGSSDNLRILLETDAPYMVPANIYDTLTTIKGKLPICHTAMIPWTADFVATFLGGEWTSEKVMKISRENARSVYGV